MDKKIKYLHYNHVYFNSIDIEEMLWDPLVNEFVTFNNVIEIFRLLTFMSTMVSSDTPNWNQAMNGPQGVGYWKACEEEIENLAKEVA